MSITAQEPLMQSLVAYLAAGTGISGAFSNRIYDSMTAQNAALNSCILSFVSDPPQMYFNAVDDVKMDFQVDIYTKMDSGAQVARQNADLVYATLHRAVDMTVSGYSGVSIICTDRGGIEETDFPVGGRTQQDALRILQQYRLQATGS